MTEGEIEVVGDREQREKGQDSRRNGCTPGWETMMREVKEWGIEVVRNTPDVNQKKIDQYYEMNTPMSLFKI